MEREQVLPLIYQFLEDNNYSASLNLLQDESGVTYKSIKASQTDFERDLLRGRWDGVLKALEGVKLPNIVLYDLYEQIVYELVEVKDSKVALELLQSDTFQNIKTMYSQKYE